MSRATSRGIRTIMPRQDDVLPFDRRDVHPLLWALLVADSPFYSYQLPTRKRGNTLFTDHLAKPYPADGNIAKGTYFAGMGAGILIGLVDSSTGLGPAARSLIFMCGNFYVSSSRSEIPSGIVPSKPNLLPIGSLLQVSGLRTALFRGGRDTRRNGVADGTRGSVILPASPFTPMTHQIHNPHQTGLVTVEDATLSERAADKRSTLALSSGAFDGRHDYHSTMFSKDVWFLVPTLFKKDWPGISMIEGLGQIGIRAGVVRLRRHDVTQKYTFSVSRTIHAIHILRKYKDVCDTLKFRRPVGSAGKAKHSKVARELERAP
ncbi:hypothetical protein EDD15DRAFT_2193370 [Pisolithus albus]|nr:hypothetical protein EDD15DRAFT_2193370 [Pisolithus albus]